MKSLEERFWEKVRITDWDECWLWIASTDSKGYGKIKVDRILVPASRVVYQLSYYDYTPELDVLHTCDNPPCCNPGHLFQGTTSDNSRDMSAKGRAVNRYGKQLPDWLKENIRLYKGTGLTQQQVADLFGISQQNISKLFSECQ